MSSMPAQSPYSSSTVTMEPSALTKQLLGLNADSPYYSPYKSMARQASNQSKILEGVTTNPSWSSAYQFFGVPAGTDLTPYIKSLQTGAVSPKQMGQAPISASPAAETIPEYTPPSKKGKAEGGLMSLKGYAKGGLTTAQTTAIRSISKAIQNGTATQAQINKINNIEAKSGLNVSPYVSTGTGTPKNTSMANLVSNTAKAYNDKQGAPVLATLGQALTNTQYGFDPTQAQGQYGGLTNPIAQQAIDQLRAAGVAPETIGQGAGIMSQNAAALQGMANYAPQQVSAQNVQGTGYQAASMQAPQDIQAQGYTAAQMQGARMRGPQQWSTRGAEQYMDPYIQSVLQNQLQLANQQNAIANAGLKSQAAGQKAFGGSRAQLALGQQGLNQTLANQQLVSQGLSNAYNTALQQFNTAQGQGLQAGQANLQAALATQQANQAAQNQAMQNYVNNALQAAQISYGGQLTAAQQNLVAQNAASQFTAANQQQANLANQQANLNAAIQNQQAGISANQMNLSALSNAGQLGQGLGSLGISSWGAQQNLLPAWNTAATNVNALGQGAVNAAQDTAKNILGANAAGWGPVSNLVTSAAGQVQQGTKSTLPGLGGMQ